MAKPDALQRREHEAPTEVMREVAALAMARNLTQDSLATKWRAIVGGSINGGNISRHFTTKTPQVETLRHYADVLGVKPEYLLLLHSGTFEDANALAAGHPDPGSASAAYWLNILCLAFESDTYQNGASDAVKESLLALPVTERNRYLKVFALAYYREKYLGESFLAIRAAQEAFERIAPPSLNLAGRRRNPADRRFVNLWEVLGDVLDPCEFDVLLALVRALHQKRGIDAAPLDTALDEDVLYQAWREGRYKREAGQ